MTDVIFGSELVLHAGGIDLKFPHHNNEIAQCEAHNGAEVNTDTAANFLLLLRVTCLCTELVPKLYSYRSSAHQRTQVSDE